MFTHSILTQTFKNIPWLLLWRTVCQFRLLITYKLVQFLQLLCFLSCCSSHTVCFCQKWQFLQFLCLIWKVIGCSRQCLSISLQCLPFHFQLTYLLHHSQLSFLAGDSIYAIARYMPSTVRPSVCLSLCLSHGWISQRSLKLGSRNFHHRVAPWL